MLSVLQAAHEALSPEEQERVSRHLFESFRVLALDLKLLQQQQQQQLIVGGLITLMAIFVYVMVECTGSERDDEPQQETATATTSNAAPTQQTAVPTRTRGGSIGRANEMDVHVVEVPEVTVTCHNSSRLIVLSLV